ncbi:cellulose binding domain-containing protein [Micromonospora sp. NPDC051006]|uniref:cellulose binding domain-containing protein n=1 Tax=Micromonospora sp. NPDC051006 TaxID=3364283 RepID=UPI0037B80AFD
MAIILLDRIMDVANAIRYAVTGRGEGSRFAQIAILASLAVLVATAVPVVLVLRTPERLAPVALDPPPNPYVPNVPEPGTPGAEALPPASARPSPTRPSATATPTSAAPPTTAGPATTSAPAAVPLRADFAIGESALLSYGATVTIQNPGPAAAPKWTLVVTLPRESLDVTAVSGARASRDGAKWIFVPDGAAGQVPGRGSTRVTFRVAGAPISAAPTACTIDGAACAGLPD